MTFIITHTYIGIYFGTQGNPDDERPLNGVNLYPNESMKDVVETYMQYMNQLGEMLMKAIVLSLGLDYSFVDINFQEPTELFRVFGMIIVIVILIIILILIIIIINRLSTSRCKVRRIIPCCRNP